MNIVHPIRISNQRRFIGGVLAGGLLLALTMLFAVNPSRLPIPECAFHSYTGHSCLTCGLTRSIHAVEHGELTVSMHYHLFGPAVFIGMILCVVLFGLEAVWGRSVAIQANRGIRYWTIAAFAAGWLLYWGIRLACEFRSN
jgi:hypothetical protein